MKPTAEIFEEAGKKGLRIDFNRKGVSIAMPVEPDVLDIAIGALIENLAGVSKAELLIVAMKALHPELA